MIDNYVHLLGSGFARAICQTLPINRFRLDRVVVEEMLWCLHQADRFVMKQQHHAPQEIALRHEIGIERP